MSESMSFFHNIPLLPEDPILSLPAAFAAERNPTKVNLGIGAYKSAEGASLVLTCVRAAENQIIQKQLLKDYLPIDGDPEFIRLSLPVILGKEIIQKNGDSIFGIQTLGGSCALRIGGEFLARNLTKNIFISQPSWHNHKTIFEAAGLSVGSYPYYDFEKRKLDFSGMLQAISNIPKNSAILLHASCHNPTGFDPSPEQWKELSALIKKQGILPFFDMAYQGFGQDMDQDAYSVRSFIEDGHEILLAYSFSKNLGLYGERVGMLIGATSDSKDIPSILSQLKFSIRGMYSNPPLQGVRIVSTILRSPELTGDWKNELKNMCERVFEMKKALHAALLVKSKNQRSFSEMLEQKGIFMFCGLNPAQVERLRVEKGIYMPSNGRINVAGLNTQNIDYVAEALLSVI